MSAEEPTVGFVQSQLVVLKKYKHINFSIIKRLLKKILCTVYFLCLFDSSFSVKSVSYRQELQINFRRVFFTMYTVANEECDSHVYLLSSNFILAYKLNFR